MTHSTRKLAGAYRLGRRRAESAIGLVLSLLMIVTGCGAARSEKPNIVVISVDTLRADHLPIYHYARPTAPNIDQLGREGIVFDRAYTQASHTLPAHASLLTALHPRTHGVTLDAIALSRDDLVVGELLRERAGYHTAAFVNAFLSPRYGYDRGFDVYDFGDPPRDAEQTNSAVAAWLQDRMVEPFFLFVHYYDVHSDWEHLPYDSPPDFQSRFAVPRPDDFVAGNDEAVASRYLVWRMKRGLRFSEPSRRYLESLYDAGLAYTDAQIGMLLGRLRDRGLLDRSMVIIVSDHGEEFEDHGKLLHGQLFEETVRIPLVLWVPELGGSAFRACNPRDPGLQLSRRQGGKRVSAVVQLIDLVPTILSCLGETVPDSLQGRDLLAAIAGTEARQEAYFQTLEGEQLGITRGRWKLIQKGNRSRLFDLERDPGERIDLAERHPRLVAELSQRLEQWKSTSERSVSKEQSAVGIDERTRQLLESLGYGS